jgi:formylglycine-generating enzyme required for sulfatase activity
MEMKRSFTTLAKLWIILMLLIACSLTAPKTNQDSIHPETEAAQEIAAQTEISSTLPAATEIETKTPATLLTETEIWTKVPTIVPTGTEIWTKAPEPTLTPVLGTGSIQISPKDGMNMVYVPAGEFIMGSLEGVGNPNEHPQNTQNVAAFWIDQTEVTNAMFSLFVNETHYKTGAETAGKSYSFTDDLWHLVDGADWAHPFGPLTSISGTEDHPVVQVSWKDALAYCQWAGRTLPTEAQWEKAARGTNGSIYPWGNAEPTSDLVNFADSSSHFSTSSKSVNDGFEFSAPAGSFPAGMSIYGALDMAGNVWEWVSSLALTYPYNATDGREDLTQVNKRVLRGGSWFDTPTSLRTADRYEYDQTYTGLNTGFRCALPIQ